TTGSGLGYQITTDFTPYRGYPELAQGDADAADWITNALRKIDQDIGTGVIGGGTSTSATAGSQTLPSNPAGFINVIIAGVARKIPYYNV
ncbi:MAG: hypothetical protein IT393_07075, partial [Nitrospirae bacterium]|nr:hypothetical protein [Nitrospirota bacterium]